MRSFKSVFASANVFYLVLAVIVGMQSAVSATNAKAAFGIGGLSASLAGPGAGASGLGGIINGVGGGLNQLTNTIAGAPMGVLQAVPNTLNAVGNLVTKPLTGVLSNVLQPHGRQLGVDHSAGSGLEFGHGLIGGLTTAMGAATGIEPLNNIVNGAHTQVENIVSGLSNGLMGNSLPGIGLGQMAALKVNNALQNPIGTTNVMRQAAGLAANTANLAAPAAAVAGASGAARAAGAVGALAGAAGAAGVAGAAGAAGAVGTMSAAAETLSHGASLAAGYPSGYPGGYPSGYPGGYLGYPGFSQAGLPGAEMASLAGATGLAGSAAALGPIAAEGVVEAATAEGVAAARTGSAMMAANHVAGRPGLAGDALANAQAEAAIAGADMAAHGANNARSVALAGNAYRQAHLASARDRVNIAGTVQNSARISDAAIATHDASTKAEDSLLGSELAVDSAATVLDSDAAYIPPVTNSLLRSLPYGRLGLRNILPKPLTYPSVLLPDVWLNGHPVNYLNVPFRMLPYGIGSTAATNQLQLSGAQMTTGQPLINGGQPFYPNNGAMVNGMVFDPNLALLNTASGVLSSSIVPILANGQLEALDEVAASHLMTTQQKAGPGMLGTYNGYGKLNPVPMLTGSVSDANLVPTTTIGTTYPIGSALVIEPRDSYFQDYVDNASSRQNFDEHQQ